MKKTRNRYGIIGILAAATLLAACGGSSSSTSNAAVTRSTQALCDGTAVVPERLFLQQVGPDRAIVKWRGNSGGGAEATTLCYGTESGALPASSEVIATQTATGHMEALLTGLNPDTRYYYSVGGAGSAAAGHSFLTAPTVGNLPSDGNIRIWVVGDSGRVTGAEPVRDAYKQWVAANGGEAADLFLMLGDNAYANGTDEEYQSTLFEVFPEVLAGTGMWSTIGNHDMGQGGTSSSADPTSYSAALADPAPDSPMPYLNIHTLPANAESGGVPSGTEQYYSFDYGNVHVVSLDSQLSNRDPTMRQSMADWLEADLMANTQDWTIVIFHHPPYSKGINHDSDIEQAEIDMREVFTPLFEDHGVDAVFSGHAHSYERSYYIKDHTGDSSTFDVQQHAELNAANEGATGQNEQAYAQISPSSGMDDKVVYTVAGSSGQADNDPESGGIVYPPCTVPGQPAGCTPDDWLEHPAHFVGLVGLGSVVIDVTETTFTSYFISNTAEVRDFFVITR